MSRTTLIAALASALALAPLASAQSAAPAFFAERAPLALSSSSSSGSDAFAYSPASSSAAQAHPAGDTRSSLPFSGLAVGVKVGVAGIGFDVATPLVPGRLNLRGGATFFSYSDSTTTSDNLVVNGTLKLQNSGVMVDWFPFHGRFRISGGGTVYNFTNLAATINVPAGQSFTLGNDTYYSQNGNPLNGTGVFNLGGKGAGRVSIGTGNMLPRHGRFTFQGELGVEFRSAPTVAFNFTGGGCTSPTATGPTCGPVQTSDITAEQVKIQNDLTDLKYYPILSFGLAYRIH